MLIGSSYASNRSGKSRVASAYARRDGDAGQRSREDAGAVATPEDERYRERERDVDEHPLGLAHGRRRADRPDGRQRDPHSEGAHEGDERDPQPARNGDTIENQEHSRRHEERERDPAPRLREVRTVARVGGGHDGCDRRSDDDGSRAFWSWSTHTLALLCDRAMRHRLGTLLLVIGIGVLAWTATVYLWKDPFTTAYTAYEQRRLESNLDRQFETWKPSPEAVARPGKPKPKPPARRRLSRSKAVQAREQ